MSDNTETLFKPKVGVGAVGAGGVATMAKAMQQVVDANLALGQDWATWANALTKGLNGNVSSIAAVVRESQRKAPYFQAQLIRKLCWPFC